MERYFKRKLSHESTEPSSSPKENSKISTHAWLEDLPVDPGLRTRIWDYHPNVRDQVRREYLKKGPFQPRNHLHPAKDINGGSRTFISAWFDEFPNWLEYSIEKDAAFCLCCYLFKPNTGEQSGSDCFVSRGFSNWKRKERLLGHVGGHNSAHNQAWSNCEALLKQNQERKDYKTLLGGSIACTRYLLSQGFLFCGEYEFADPNNEGDFLEFLKFLCVRDEELKAVTSRNAPLRLKLTSLDTQKDIIVATSVEIINAIAREMGDSAFSILIDELHDRHTVNQMAIVLRFVDNGHVIERFLGIVQATDCTAVAMKVAIDDFFSSHGLTMSKLRGQSYGGTTNMQGEMNSLKALIMKENECAFYVHCFAHDLHSTLVDAVRNHYEIWGLFTDVPKAVKVIGEFLECRDYLQEKHGVKIFEALNTSELLCGQGLNEGSSKLKTLTIMLTMFISVIDVLEVIEEFGYNSEQKFTAHVLMGYLWSFDFIFSLLMMVNILEITDGLAQTLQKKDQDIMNAMNLLRSW